MEANKRLDTYEQQLNSQTSHAPIRSKEDEAMIANLKQQQEDETKKTDWCKKELHKSEMAIERKSDDKAAIVCAKGPDNDRHFIVSYGIVQLWHKGWAGLKND